MDRLDNCNDIAVWSVATACIVVQECCKHEYA